MRTIETDLYKRAQAEVPTLTPPSELPSEQPSPSDLSALDEAEMHHMLDAHDREQAGELPDELEPALDGPPLEEAGDLDFTEDPNFFGPETQEMEADPATAEATEAIEQSEDEIFGPLGSEPTPQIAAPPTELPHSPYNGAKAMPQGSVHQSLPPAPTAMQSN